MDLLEIPDKVLCRHPWENARFRFFKKILDPILKTNTPLRILDVGAGDGWISFQLNNYLPPSSEVVCWDINYTPDVLEDIAKHSVEGIQFVSKKPSGKFDIVLALDVLEHIEDDNNFLNLVVNEHLAVNGVLLASVPAWGFLFSNHDRFLKHYRRYSFKQWQLLLRSSDLTITTGGGLFHILLFPRLFEKIVEVCCRDRSVKNDHSIEWKGTNIATYLMDFVLSVDNAVSCVFTKLNLQLPGLSWWALCQKQ